MLASFAAALLSKEVAVTLPVLATLFEHFYREDRSQTSLRTKLTRYGGLWVLTGIYLTVRLILFRGVLAKSSHADLTWSQVFLHGISLFGQYVRRFLWPVPLSFYNPFQKSILLSDPGVLFGFFALFAAAALFVVLWIRWRLLSFPILWTLVTLALVLNARWMPGTVFAERYWYLPSVGCCWLLGVGVVELLKPRSSTKPVFRWSLAVGTAAVALLAARATVARNRDWKSDRALCTQTLVVHPHAAHFRVNLGEMSWQAGDHDEAERQWRLALADEPNEPFALWSLGKAMLEQKRYDESLAYLQQSIAVSPQPYAAPHIYRGRVFLALGKNVDAEAEFRRAVEIDPFRADARNELGRFYFDAGNYADAEQQFLASVASIPSTEGYKGLAEVSEVLNKPLQAEAAWKQVLAIEPFDARAHLGLGKIYLARKSFSDAQREFQAVLLMNPHNEEALAAINSIKSGATGSQP
jgi:tetratricopeptide (TPR) repeat protein